MPEMVEVPYPDHPERCQGRQNNKGREGQCLFFREEGSTFCIIHGAGFKNSAVKELNLYRIKKYQKRLLELKSANGARTIDEELAILRMVLEEILIKCEAEGDMGLLLYSIKISEMVRDIKNCVLVADKMATKAGQLIGRTEAIVIAGKVVQILSEEITDQSALGRIGERVLNAFTNTDETEDN